MDNRTHEKAIFRTLHLILETQKMIELYESDTESEKDYFEINANKDMLKILSEILMMIYYLTIMACFR